MPTEPTPSRPVVCDDRPGARICLLSELDRRILMHGVACSFGPIRRLTLKAPAELVRATGSREAVGTALETDGSEFRGVVFIFTADNDCAGRRKHPGTSGTISKTSLP
jgi:hypothetical protein